MSKKSLFRGKRVDNDEWAEGFYGQPQGEGSSYADIYVWEKPEFSDSIELVRRVVYATTVRQFTGLTDKNGKKIFEGDILQYRNSKGEYELGYVYYDKGKGAFMIAQKIGSGEVEYTFDDIHTQKLLIIGNINSNYELLEE